MENDIKKYLDRFVSKNIIIKQEGFIKSKYGIKKMKYLLENDILTITGEENTNYLQININQVYKIDIEEDKIILTLDNDITVIINI